MKPGHAPLGADPESWSQEAQDLFLALVDQRESGECWRWLGRIEPNGDGRFPLGGRRSLSARRTAYILQNGAIAREVVVYQTCPVGSCCNPAHLRVRNRRGPSPPRTAGLSSADVQAIRDLHGILPVRQVARLFKLHTEDVRSIWGGRDPFTSASMRQHT